MRERIFQKIYNSDITEREINNSIVSRKAAEEGFVLLKNNGVLPIKDKKNIALYGAGACKTVKGGWGSGDVNNRKSVNIKEGLENAGYTITTEKWISDYDDIYELELEVWQRRCENFKNYNIGKYIVDAIPFIMPVGRPILDEDIANSNTDVAIYVISRASGEGADRENEKGDYKLFDIEISNLKKLVLNYKDVILIINSGGIINLSFLDQIPEISAILYMAQAGAEGGNAISNIISGKVTPSGKLTDTWAKEYEDYPVNILFNNRDKNNEEYREGIYVGYRYFNSFNIAPRYEFGYGLSYTQFDIRVSDIWLEGNELKLRIKVKNIGKEYSGKEVVQIYMSAPEGKLKKEYQRLVGFTKTKLLSPNEELEYIQTIEMENIKSYDEQSACWILESGRYVVRVGNSSINNKVVGYIDLKNTVIVEKLKNICKLQRPIYEVEPEIESNQILEEAPILKINDINFERKYDTCSIKENNIVNEIIDKFSINELCDLVCGAHPEDKEEVKSYESIVPGAAGETTSNLKTKYGIPNLILADGPAGIKLKNTYTEDGKNVYQYCTAMPIGILLAQTWNPDILQEVGFCIGNEMDLFGISIWLAPGMNIHREPLCGRNFEYLSEDPLVTGIVAANLIKGLQKNNGIGATVKHFVCNNKEENRVFANIIISERALREIYLRGFEIAIKLAKPVAVMTSYNDINNVPTGNSYDLCTEVLRNEWGFTGIVMTDWFEATIGTSLPSKAIKAGNDLMMPGHLADIRNLKKSIEDGTLDIEDLKRCAKNILNVIFNSNRFEK